MVGLKRELNITMTSEREKRWSEIRTLQHRPGRDKSSKFHGDEGLGRKENAAGLTLSLACELW